MPETGNSDHLPVPVAFLASRFGEFAEVRKRAFDLNPDTWVAEYSRPDLDTLPDDLKGEMITEVCLENVRKAKAFICLVKFGYGSFEARVVKNRADVSLLEMEIFQALISRKPFYLFRPADFAPEPRLAGLVALLRETGKVREYSFLNDKDLLLQLHPLIAPALFGRRIATFFSRLSEMRTRRHKMRRFAESLLACQEPQFLNHKFYHHTDATNPMLVASLIADALADSNQARKLALLWWAVRHLSAAPFTDRGFDDFLPLWDRVLSRWGSASAWYGFHGDHILSRLAAVNTLSEIRVRMTRIAAEGGDSNGWIQGTFGAKASEYYSTAKAVPSRRLRHMLLNRALELVETALLENWPDQSGLLAIKASILLKLGRNKDAIAEYEQVLSMRQASGASIGQIGEAMSELGYAYFCDGRWCLARWYLEEGVRLLATSDKHPFTIRARRKLAAYRLATLRPFEGYKELMIAYDLAEQHAIEAFLKSLLGLILQRIRRRSLKPAS